MAWDTPYKEFRMNLRKYGDMQHAYPNHYSDLVRREEDNRREIRKDVQESRLRPPEKIYCKDSRTEAERRIFTEKEVHSIINLPHRIYNNGYRFQLESFWRGEWKPAHRNGELLNNDFHGVWRWSDIKSYLRCGVLHRVIDNKKNIVAMPLPDKSGKYNLYDK